MSVPQSARYALHKCIISQYRSNDVKHAKDMLQAESILTVQEESMPQLIADAWHQLPWKQKAERGISHFRDAGLVNRLRDIISAVA
ncbi:MAG: GSU2403 family nucleotidyltransferase fold protein [Mariprofundus sp.]